MPPYLNLFCWCGTIRSFLDTSSEDWLLEMKQRHDQASPFELAPQNIRAWTNSYHVLQNSLRSTGSAFEDLHILFEYCLPKRLFQDGEISPYCIWADAVIVSSDTAVVLEFKDRPDAIIQHARQAKMYRNRLQKYHDSSIGMRKWAILVPTLSSGLEQRMLPRVTAASPELLASVLEFQLGDAPKPHPDICSWINSTYSIHH